MSRNTVLIAAALLAAFGAWKHFSGKPGQASRTGEGVVLAASSKDAVLVYGRDSCAYTRSTLASLRSNGVPVEYIDINDAEANRAFHERFGGTGLAGERGYALPVVEFAGRVSMRPSPDAVARHVQGKGSGSFLVE